MAPRPLSRGASSLQAYRPPHLQVPAQRCSFWARPSMKEDSSRQSEKGSAQHPSTLGSAQGVLAGEPGQQQGEQETEDRGRAGSRKASPISSPGSPQAALRAAQLPQHPTFKPGPCTAVGSASCPSPTLSPPHSTTLGPWPPFCKGGRRKQMRSCAEGIPS